MANLARMGQGLMSRYLSSLAYPEYRKLWLATLCSQSANWALIVARATLVLQLPGGNAAWSGYVTFAAMIPSVLVSPLAGYLADRFDRRTVLACAYTVNVGDTLVLAVLVITGYIEPWMVVVLSAITGTARSTQMPAAQALLANMVPREGLLTAVSLYQATVQGSRFSGPFLILVVIWATGSQNWTFFLCSGLYLLGLTAVLNIRTVSRGVVEAGKFGEAFLRNMLGGLNFMYRHPLVLSIILLVVAHCGMTMSFESLLPVLSMERLGMVSGASIMAGASYLMVAYGLGALVTALALAGVRTERVRGQLFLWFAVLSGVTPVALALSPNIPLAMLAVAGMGLSQGGFMTLSHTMLQSLAPDAVRGRLMGVYNWHTTGFMAGFNLVNGTVVGFTQLSAAVTLAVGGIGFLIVITLSFVRIPLRQIYARGVPVTDANA